MATKGYESYLIAGKQSAWATPIDNDEFLEVIFEFVGSGLKNDSPPIVAPRFKSNASPMPQIENFITAGGDEALHLHADNMVMFLAQLLMDPMTDDPIVGSWEEVRAAGVWTTDEELDTQPGDTDPAQSPGRLRFTFSEAMTLSVSIYGTDSNDHVIGETVSFAAAATGTSAKYYKTVSALDFSIATPVAQTVVIDCSKGRDGDVVAPAWYEVFGDGLGDKKAWTDPDELDTQPGALDPAQDPALLKFTFSAVVTQAVVITGTDQNDAALTETLTFTNETTHTTSKYFKTVTSIDYTSAPPGGETLIIEASKNVYVHTIECADDILPGMTVEVVKGGLPSTYIGTLINQGTLAVGDVITLTLAMMAQRGWNSYVVQSEGNTVGADETPTDVSAWDRVSQEVFPAWGMALEIDDAGSATPIGSMTLVINNRLVNPTRYSGIRTLPQPVRSDNRDITLTCTIDYDADNNEWDGKFETMDEAKAVLECYRKPYGGPEYRIAFTFPRCQIGAYPDPAVTDYSELVQEIILRPIATIGAATRDELTITVQCLAAE